MNSELKKSAQNGLYEFAPDGNGCRIYHAETPRYWYNYLWNEDRYCAQISQVGHGRSYYLSEKADMCMINRDDARYVYLRDDADGTCWNIGKGSLNTEVEDYCCTHSIGHTQICSRKNGIEESWRIFVPKKGFHEVWTLKLRNTAEQEKRLSMFSAVSFYLEGFSYPRYYEMYRCMKTEFKRELNGIYCDSDHPFAPHELYHGFLASSEPVYAWDGDLTKFCGSISTLTLPDASTCALFQRPDIVVNGKDCTNSEASLFILGGVLQHKITLMPGEEKEIQVVFGISSYNEWKYDKKLVAMSGGAIGFGSKVGNGLGAAILSAFLAIGAYDATLEVASTSMRYSIYGVSNYLPVVINLVMFVIFLKFDLEEKLPKMREEIAARRAGKTIEK